MANFERFASSVSRAERKILLDEKHGDAEGRNAFPLGSSLLLEIPAPASATDAEILVLSDASGSVRSLKMQKDGKYFRIAFNTASVAENGAGLYFYKYRVSTPSGKFDMRKKKDDIGDELVYAYDGFDGAFQLLIYEKRKKYPKFMHGAVMYQIFPDRFCRGGNASPRSDAVVQHEGEVPIFSERGKSLKNNNFFCGDLAGIKKKLGYLSSLGVSVIYLNPIFEAYSNHRYDTGDYMKVDELLGGEKALTDLIKAARRRGIRIILDGVFNHTGDNSVYFNKYGKYGEGGAYRSKTSPYFKWYNFRKYPDEYEAWWGIRILPRVNCDEPSYREFICGKDGVVRKYLKLGAAGWRLDVADELSDDFLKVLKASAVAQKKDAYVLGEVWEDASLKTAYGVRRRYFFGDELDGVMNYPCRTAIIKYLRDGDYKLFLNTLDGIYGNYPPENANLLMNILGTHDTERILTALAGEAPDGKSMAELSKTVLSEKAYAKGKKLLKMAYVILSTIPGVPCIYYGDEAGMQGYGDPLCRAFYPWGKEDVELLDFFRTVSKARRREKILKTGRISVRFADRDVACYERTLKGKTLVVVANRSEKTYEFVSGGATEMITKKRGATAEIPPMTASVFKIKKDGAYTVCERITPEK